MGPRKCSSLTRWSVISGINLTSTCTDNHSSVAGCLLCQAQPKHGWKIVSKIDSENNRQGCRIPHVSSVSFVVEPKTLLYIFAPSGPPNVLLLLTCSRGLFSLPGETCCSPLCDAARQARQGASAQCVRSTTSPENSRFGI